MPPASDKLSNLAAMLTPSPKSALHLYYVPRFTQSELHLSVFGKLSISGF